jgi:hypothetical protein
MTGTTPTFPTYETIPAGGPVDPASATGGSAATAATGGWGGPGTPGGGASGDGAGGDGRGLRVGLLAAGSALVVGVVVLGGVQFAVATTGEDASGSYAVPDAFTELVVDTSAADVTVRYDEAVSETRLGFDSGGSPLRFDHDVRGGDLHVSVRNPGFWPFSGLFTLGTDASLDIVLPAELEPVGLDLETSAGRVEADGEFAAVSVDSSAGDIELSGSADSLDLDSSAGNVSGTGLDVTGAVSSDSSAGNTTLEFVSLPSSIRVDSSAGNVRVALPDGDYDIRTDTAAGSVDQGLRSTPGASRVYRFDTSAGNVVLEPAAG